MFVPLLDRILAPLVFYAFVVALVYGLRSVLPNLLTAVVFSLATVWVGYVVALGVSRERKLDRLGKRAWQNRQWAWTPWHIGMLFEAIYYFTTERTLEWWTMVFHKHGNPQNPYTVEGITIGERIIFTADEENIKAILASQFGAFGKGPQFRKEWKDFLGLSIFTTDGTLWHDSRTLLRPQFVKDRVSDLQTFEKHVQHLLPLLAGNANGATVRVDDLFYRFTLDAVTDFLLGKSVDSLENGQTKFATAFSEVQRVQALIARAGPLRGWVPKKSFFESLDVMNEFIGTYIDRALQLSPDELEKKSKSDEGYTFLHAIAGYTQNRQVLRDQLVAVLLAGRDTTAVTLSWLFYELSRQPQIVHKLRQEILNHVGLHERPSYTNLKDMRYLQHTINECLRLYPVVPYNVRVALEDTTLPRGGGPDGNEPIGVSEGTPVGYSTLVLQRRQDIYPPESAAFPHYLKFAPERWDSWTPKAWTYIPFNGGPRICIGQQFALTEMAYTVVRILQTFERIESRMASEPALKADIVLQPAPSVDVAFFRAEKS
nr:cytochrome p450 52a13 [Quercus suber]